MRYVTIALIMIGVVGCEPNKPTEETKQTPTEISTEIVQERYFKSHEDCDPEVSECTYVQVLYPKFSGDLDFINALIDTIKSPAFDPDLRKYHLDSAADRFINSYAEYIEEFPDADIPWYLEHNVQVISQDNDYIQVSATINEYGGGAHPNYTENHYIIDRATKKLVGLKDLYKEEQIERLSAVLYFTIDPEINVYVETIMPNNNFILTADSITFVYNPYEIAPYSEGIVTITIPKDQTLPM